MHFQLIDLSGLCFAADLLVGSVEWRVPHCQSWTLVQTLAETEVPWELGVG